MPKKRLLLLLLLIILSLGLMTYQSNKERLRPFRFLDTIINKFHVVADSLRDSATTPFKRMLLREEENIRLKAELNRLLREQHKYQEILHENKRFRELLSIREKESRYITTARVIARVSDQWSHIFVLNKGLSDGVTKDMTAITHRGLAGKISDASDSYSYLLLVTDINFSAAVRLRESRREGVISGTGLRKCQLKYIPYDEEVKVNDVVITSGLDSLFPKGIPVGYVSKIGEKKSGLFQRIEVTPSEDNKKIEEVVIIKQ